MATQDTIIRKTYSAGGQAIATRVAGDPESGNNGLFYFHSDHLGSATFLTYGNGHGSEGEKKSNSTKFFTPFGEYRIQPSYPTSEITDRGFTGHKQNDEIGLIYMNARYYLGEVGRFLSADTLVPNPGNPQSFNRYSYVLNNPLAFIDPSGHGECNADDNCQSQGYQPSEIESTTSLIDFTGNGWTEADKKAVEQGSLDVGRAAAQEIYEETGVRVSPQEAFFLIYGDKVTFNRVGIGCEEDDRNTIPCAARTEGRNEITVYNEADIVTNVTHWATHELGHAFIHAVGSSKPINELKMAQKRGDVPDRIGTEDADATLGFAGDLNHPWEWQQSPSGAASEEFADMFLGWTYGQWETTVDGQLTNAGWGRSHFMAKFMPTYINKAIANP